jgi:hypothetical protein
MEHPLEGVVFLERFGVEISAVPLRFPEYLIT